MSDEFAVPAVEQPAEAVAPVPAPVAADPIEGAVIPPAAADHAGADQEPGGVPAAHLAAGGLSAGAVALGGLYQLLGLAGLVGGGVLAAGSGIAYVRHRYGGRQTRGRTWGVSWEDGQAARRPGRRGASAGGGVLGGLRSEARSARSGGGRRTGESRAAGGGRTGGASAGRGGHRAGGLGSGPTASKDGRRSSRGTAAARADHGGRSSRNFARRASDAAKAAGGGVRKAASWANDKTGGRAGRAARAGVRAAASGTRRAAVWADRKTGRRVSSAYRAATTGKDTSFRARRRRAAAVLGWHGPLTGPVLALVAVLAGRWRARKARKAETASTSETSADSAAETASEAPADDDPAITERLICPRCSSVHTATIPAGQPETWVVCLCGLRIRVYREPTDPGDPPDNWDQAAETNQTTATADHRRRRPYTAPTTTIRRNTTVSANPLAAAAAELNAVAAGHAPVDMWQVARELDQLPEVPANVGMALRTYTTRLQGEYPIHPAVVEALGELYIAHAQLVSVAESIGPLFRQVHAEDLKREEAPRINEQAWNV